MKDLFDITNLPRAQDIRGYFSPDMVLSTLLVMIGVGRGAEDHEPTLRRVARQWHYWIKQLIIINSFNRNLQIITHVLSCEAGKAWARKTIGMGRLKHWLFRYHNPAENAPKSAPRSAPRSAPKSAPQKPAERKPIKWSIIGLTPVSVFIGTRASTTAPAQQTAPRRAAQKRPFTPARFVPWELGVVDDISATPEMRQVRTNIFANYLSKFTPDPFCIKDPADKYKPP